MTSEAVEFDLAGKHLVICIPAYDGNMPTDQVVSVINTINLLKTHGVDTTLEIRAGSALIPKARAELIHAFLDHTDGTHALCVDSDVVWEPNDAVRLLAFCTEVHSVCAPYPTKEDPADFHYSLFSDKHGKAIQSNRGLIKMKSAPMGFNCFSREGLEMVRSEYPELNAIAKRSGFEGETINQMFHMEIALDEEGIPRLIGEDIAFYRRWVEVWGEAWMDASIQLKHLGRKAYRKDYREYLSEKSAERRRELDSAA